MAPDRDGVFQFDFGPETDARMVRIAFACSSEISALTAPEQRARIEQLYQAVLNKQSEKE